MFEIYVAPVLVQRNSASKMPRVDMSDPLKKIECKPHVAEIDSEVFNSSTNEWREGLRRDNN